MIVLPHLPQNLRQEILKTQRDIPVPILIILLEHIRHPLQTNTSLHEQIKAHDAFPPLIISLEQNLDEPVAQAVPERHQRVGKLIQRNVTRAVRVEPVKQRAPGGQERPEPAKLLEPNRPAPVAVEHADHHAHRLRVERRPVAVD